MRLFIAIDLEKAVKSSLEEAILSLKKSGINGSFVKKDNMHITLVFIGETSRLENISEVLERCTEIPPFELNIKTPGSFKEPDGDILWLGTGHSKPLRDLQKNLQNGLSAQGFSFDSKPYRPHITLARRATIPAGLDFSIFDFIHIKIKVSKITLFRSDFISGKPVHSIIDEYLFQNGETQ